MTTDGGVEEIRKEHKRAEEFDKAEQNKELLLTDELVQGYYERLIGRKGIILKKELKVTLENFLAKAKPIIEKQQRERIEKLFDDVPAPITFIRTHSVEDCFLIKVSDWQALKGEK